MVWILDCSCAHVLTATVRRRTITAFNKLRSCYDRELPSIHKADVPFDTGGAVKSSDPFLGCLVILLEERSHSIQSLLDEPIREVFNGCGCL
jgi:hypothetical protein